MIFRKIALRYHKRIFPSFINSSYYDYLLDARAANLLYLACKFYMVGDGEGHLVL